MEILSIFLIGAGTGMFLSVLSMILLNVTNAEQYPLGGFLPALWMLTDLGGSSELAEGGILMLGGMSGYFLMLTFRKESPEALRNALQEKIMKNQITKQNVKIVPGKSLAEFL